jgi:hypothetical protein
MKTAAEIIAYLEMELAEAFEMYDHFKGKNASEAFLYHIKATTIMHLLEEIKYE